MTDDELLSLYEARKAAWAETIRPTPAGYAAGDAYRVATAAIVAELRRRNAPASLPGFDLRLTADGLNFLACQPGKLLPLVMPSQANRNTEWENYVSTYNRVEDSRRGKDRKRTARV